MIVVPDRVGLGTLQLPPPSQAAPLQASGEAPANVVWRDDFAPLWAFLLWRSA